MLIVLFLFTAVTTAALCLWAYGAREDIEKQDPRYAAALYRSGTDLFWSRGMPLRGYVLLFTKPSSVSHSTLVPLKIIYCINAILITLCAASLLVPIGWLG
jgi:hypothetical protein